MPVRLLALLAALALPAAAAAQAPPEPTPQRLFGEHLMTDTGTRSSVKRILGSGAGFVSPRPKFADLTGDGRSDAVVTVENGGAAGVVAVYVFSADDALGGGLRTIYRSQSLYRASTRVSGATLTIVVPQWARGDDLCCPRRLTEREYAWHPPSLRFERQETRTVGPAP